MMRRAFTPLAVGSIFVTIAVVVLAATRSEPPVSTEGLPPATFEPDCPVGQGAGTYHITWVRGSSLPRPREALAAALGTAKRHLGSTAGFTGRYVRIGGGVDATLGREFTLVGPDGELEVMGLAVWQSDGGWLVSGLTQCYLPPPGEAA